MTSRLSSLGKLKAALKKVGGDLGREGREVVDAVKSNGWNAQGAKAAGREVKEAAVILGAESVGVAGVAGLRYPVSRYESQVSPLLTRGSRIDDPGAYAVLAQRGFKGIVDLTLEGTLDASEAPRAGLHALNVKILDNSAPTVAQMKQFLDFATAAANSPCYVHCEAGKGRTGVAVACYRMAVEGWPLKRAVAEAKQFGLSLPNQLEFLDRFSLELQAGRIAGYPRAP